jgi:HAD superfamily hydrolase (TIGR01509 family)
MLNSQPAAVIFDLDGVLIDSSPYHYRKWVQFFTERGVAFDPEKLPRQILGPRNDVILRQFFGNRLTEGEIRFLTQDLERRFREAIGPHAQPLPGIPTLIKGIHAAGIPMAVASSAVAKNVEFIVAALGLKSYFRFLLNGDEVTHPKPDPEIYLQAAAKLGKPAAACVVFEDTYVGVEAAKRAGMKCVAIASTFSSEELRSHTKADLVVETVEGLTVKNLRDLFA